MNNNILKEKVKEILMKIGTSNLFQPKRVISILMKGLTSKNTKTCAECLECIALMIQTHQLEVINEKDIHIIGKITDNPDNGIRQGALSACEEIYKITGDHFWELVGSKLSPKSEDMIKARLKANLGVAFNNTPVEDDKDVHMGVNKSPFNSSRRDRSKGGLNRSLNSSQNLQSSIPLSDASSKPFYLKII